MTNILHFRIFVAATVVGSQVDYQGFQLERAYLTLTSNIVTAAVKKASLRAQIKATREILAVVQEEAVEGKPDATPGKE